MPGLEERKELISLILAIITITLIHSIFWGHDITIDYGTSLDGKQYQKMVPPFYDTQSDITEYFKATFNITEETSTEWIDVVADDCAERITVNNATILEDEGCNRDVDAAQASAEHRQTTRIYLTEENNFREGLNTIIVMVPNKGGIHSPKYFNITHRTN
ncbi:MAG: hypothetical protein ABIH11_05755, partial [Candidatus Altiarchaeota archaeon]